MRGSACTDFTLLHPVSGVPGHHKINGAFLCNLYNSYSAEVCPDLCKSFATPVNTLPDNINTGNPGFIGNLILPGRKGYFRSDDWFESEQFAIYEREKHGLSEVE